MFFGMRIRSLIGRRDWREDVSAYMDGELSARERTRMEMRLATSAEMREYLADLEEMRSVLRGFEPSPSASPFQLTTEMLNQPERISVQPANTARALRLSMSTAAVGVATFAAVMVFDAVDSPTVTFTTTAAGDTAGGVPTAAVVTDEIEVQSQSQQAAQSAAAQQLSQPEAAAVAQDREAEESATVASVEVQEEQAQTEQEVQESYVEEEAAAQAQQAADDPSRRAITAGRGGSDAEAGAAERVTAEDVVQQQETATEASDLDQSEQAEPPAAETEEESDSAQAEAADAPTTALDDEESQATSQTQTATRTVATSVRHTQSDWPLEQRPRSTTMQLARDPSWEGPVQIVLAVIAIGATLLWLGLTIVDRRRRT